MSKFSLPFRVDDILSVVSATYAHETQKRGFEPHFTPEVKKNLQAVSKWLADPDAKPWLVLYGPSPGTGKTTIAKTIYSLLQYPKTFAKYIESTIEDDANRLIDEICPGYREYWGAVERATWEEHNPESFAKIKQVLADRDRMKKERLSGAILFFNFNPPRPDQFRTAQDIADGAERRGHEWLDYIKKEQILFIDDLGWEATIVNNFGTQILPISEVLSYRYSEMLPCVMTSNLSDQALAEKYGERIADRLREMAAKLAFKGTSFRK